MYQAQMVKRKSESDSDYFCLKYNSDSQLKRQLNNKSTFWTTGDILDDAWIIPVQNSTLFGSNSD